MTLNPNYYTLQLQAAAAANGMSTVEYQEHLETQTGKRLERIPLLEIVPLAPKRRVPQPKLKVGYETREDIRARLSNSFIWVGPALYHVIDIYWHKDEFWLVVEDEHKQWKVPYKATEFIDLRSPEPQYVALQEFTGFLTRRPDRQFQQGANRNCMYIKKVGGKSNLRRMDNVGELIPALKNVDTLQWQPSFLDLMVKARALSCLRLSPCLAFYRDKENRLMAEYRGRPLGQVNDNCVDLDELDFAKPWIKSDLHEVGCVPRKGKDATPQVEPSYD